MSTEQEKTELSRLFLKHAKFNFAAVQVQQQGGDQEQIRQEINQTWEKIEQLRSKNRIEWFLSMRREEG